MPGVPIIINGGIASLDEARAHLDRVDGVMLGRAAYQEPWRLLTVDPELFGEAAPQATMKDVFEAMTPYIEDQLARGTRLHSIDEAFRRRVSWRAGRARVPPPSRRERRQAGRRRERSARRDRAGRGACGGPDRRVTRERFQAKACPGFDPGWRPVRVKKTRQIKNPEPRFDSIETGKGSRDSRAASACRRALPSSPAGPESSCRAGWFSFVRAAPPAPAPSARPACRWRDGRASAAPPWCARRRFRRRRHIRAVPAAVRRPLAVS